MAQPLAISQPFSQDAETTAKFQHSGNNAANNEQQYLLQYLYLVKRVVTHLRSQLSSIHAYEDLIQIGSLGLLEAIRRYGAAPDDAFEGYAFQRIRGAILDELRRLDWRPRQARQQGNKLNQHRRALTKKLGRDVSNSELAAAMEISIEQLLEMQLDSVAEEMYSMDEMLENGSSFDGESGNGEYADLKQSVMQALSQLPEREQLLLTLYYQHELNMKEIALTLDVTESRVCQLHKLAVKQLKDQLADLL
ncbi:RNA polymerase sigma factor FliA [Thalassotalea sp. PLHSN55]|uniref:RNA polymerase sigma factor FliA n=1 Tax=Thalassotalea sp. PLHSN55 TaxID=3435888 RepID=UPI003F850575